MDEDGYLMMSGIQHYSFCRRQWALIHIEQQWSENHLTIEGELGHKNAHSPEFVRHTKDSISYNAVRVVSKELKLSGICDVIEFKKSADGIKLKGHEGFWQLEPIEYKHGGSIILADTLQLCAQAMALEEMFSCNISYGSIYHISSRKREEVEITQDLKQLCAQIVMEMHSCYDLGETPAPCCTEKCKSCSLFDICLPLYDLHSDTASYIKNNIV